MIWTLYKTDLKNKNSRSCLTLFCKTGKIKFQNLENILLISELMVLIKSGLEARFQSECLHPVLQVKALTICSKIMLIEDPRLCQKCSLFEKKLIED